MTLDDALYGTPTFRVVEPLDAFYEDVYPMVVATWPDGFYLGVLGGQEMLDDEPFVESCLIPMMNERRARIEEARRS